MARAGGQQAGGQAGRRRGLAKRARDQAGAGHRCVSQAPEGRAARHQAAPVGLVAPLEVAPLAVAHQFVDEHAPLVHAQQAHLPGRLGAPERVLLHLRHQFLSDGVHVEPNVWALALVLLAGAHGAGRRRPVLVRRLVLLRLSLIRRLGGARRVAGRRRLGSRPGQVERAQPGANLLRVALGHAPVGRAPVGRRPGACHRLAGLVLARGRRRGLRPLGRRHRHAPVEVDVGLATVGELRPPGGERARVSEPALRLVRVAAGAAAPRRVVESHGFGWWRARYWAARPRLAAA